MEDVLYVIYIYIYIYMNYVKQMLTLFYLLKKISSNQTLEGNKVSMLIFGSRTTLKY